MWLLDFWKKKLSVDTKYPSLSLLIMMADGQLNLIIFAKCTVYIISTLLPNGRSAMVWLRG
jgi:hypothetical protein